MAEKNKTQLDILNESIENIRNDRDLVDKYIKDIESLLIPAEPLDNKIRTWQHVKLGPVVGRYIELKQKANEQFVKLLTSAKNIGTNEEENKEIEEKVIANESVKDIVAQIQEEMLREQKKEIENEIVQEELAKDE